MTTRDKLIDRILSAPSDVTYDEVKRFFAIFGYEEDNKGSTSGSRVQFIEPESGLCCTIHKPHPAKIVKKSSLKKIITFVNTNKIVEKYNHQKGK